VKDDLRRLLERAEIPGEHEARERAWQVVRAAHAEREAAPRPLRRLAPAIALGLAAVVVAVAFTPPGQAVVETVRKAIGVESAEEALFSLPAPGRLLVVSDAGAWVVGEDGSKRFLGDFREAAWSPFGRFVVAVRPNELVALEPDGDVRWKLARRRVSSPRWGGTLTDTRIAYVSGGTARVVVGDGTGDRALGPGSALAWRPGAQHVLAIAAARRIRAVDADTGRALWTAGVAGARELAWSADGRLLLAITSRGLQRVSSAGVLLGGIDRGVTAAAFAPRGHALAVLRRTGNVTVDGEVRFRATGSFRDLTWSPDGGWLAVGWVDADQLVFVRAAGPRRLEAAANLSRQFDSTSFVSLAGWSQVASS
jgi:hypothetical protein